MISSDRKIDIMGIVNLTDNSFYSGSRCLDQSGKVNIPLIIEKVTKMIEEGVDILDLGACSTRPGSDPTGKDEEWKRLEPTLIALRKEFPEIRISIDTYWAEVVQKTFDTIGDFLVNDISAGEDDPQMLDTVGKLSLEYVAMHKRGNTKTMQSLTQYNDVTEDVIEYFKEFDLKAQKASIKNWILDPGFGFAKDVKQNYTLLRDLEKFSCLGKKILVGVSRKSMIYKPLGITPEEALAPTQVVHLSALIGGADILRVHDVLPARQTIEVYKNIY